MVGCVSQCRLPVVFQPQLLEMGTKVMMGEQDAGHEKTARLYQGGDLVCCPAFQVPDKVNKFNQLRA